METKGELMAGLKNDEIDEIKSIRLQFASLIDLLEKKRERIHEYKQSLIDIAQRRLEDACIYAVKACQKN